MKTKNIYNVHFDLWIHPYCWSVPVKAYDEKQAKRIARRICKLGIIKTVEHCDANEAAYLEDTTYPATEGNTEHLIDCE